MELNKKSMKRILLLVVSAILIYWGIHNMAILGKAFSDVLALISPFLIGLCIAFLINLVLVPMETQWQRIWKNKKRKKPWMQAFMRPTCLACSALIFLGVICAVFFVLIPQLEKTGSDFVKNFSTYINEIGTWWTSLSDSLGKHGIVLPEIRLDQDTIMSAINSFFKERGSDVVGKTLDITVTVFGVVIKLLLAFVFALYLLAQKELWKDRSRRLLFSFLNKKTTDELLRVLSLSNTSFANFVTGQVLDALVIGFLCYIGMLIFRFPSALSVSVIVCFTALVPIFGAWIGAIIGAALIVVVSPIKALWFIVFLVILQQIEGNLIYPKIVGKSVGLPGMLVLAAVTIGGGAFGVIGMLLAVPLCSVIYTLVREHIEKKNHTASAGSACSVKEQG